jgi:NitT/TauT family transport system permease protein
MTAVAARHRTGAGAFLRRYLPAAAIFVAGIALWEAVVVVFEIERFLLPQPSRIARVFVDEFDVVVAAGWLTMRKAMAGFAIGAGAGATMALLTSRWPLIRDGAMPFAVAVNSTPIIALAPIMNNWFPITSIWPGAMVVALVVFFPVMINMVRGLSEVPAGSLELLDSYGAGPRQVLRKVRLPHSLPYLFSAFKVGTTLSIIAAVVSEYFGGSRENLGVYISQQAALFHFAEAWAAILVASFSGIVFYLALVLVERAVMPWHASVRDVA